MQIEDHYEQAEAALEACLYKVQKEAALLVDAHWEAIKAQEQHATSWSDKSILQLSSFRKGNHIQIKWVSISWFGRGASRRQVMENIQKKSEFGYTPASLKKFAKEWEWPLVEETERKMTLLRKQAHFLVKSKMALRNAAIVEGKLNAAVEEDAESPLGDKQ